MCDSFPEDILFVEIARWASRATRTIISYTCRRGHDLAAMNGRPLVSDPTKFWYKFLADKFERDVLAYHIADLAEDPQCGSQAESRFWVDLCRTPQTYGRAHLDNTALEIVFAVAAKTGCFDTMLVHIPAAATTQPHRVFTELVYCLAYKYGNSRLVKFASKIVSSGSQYHHPALAMSRGHTSMVAEWSAMRKLGGARPHKNLEKETLAIVRDRGARTWTYNNNSEYVSAYAFKILEHDCAELIQELKEQERLFEHIADALLSAEIPRVLNSVLKKYSPGSQTRIAHLVSRNITVKTPAVCVRQVLPMCLNSVVDVILSRNDFEEFIPDVFARFRLESIFYWAHNSIAFLRICAHLQANDSFTREVIEGVCRSVATSRKWVFRPKTDSDLTDIAEVYISGNLPKLDSVLRCVVFAGFRENSLVGDRVRNGLILKCYANDDAELLSRVVGESRKYPHCATLKAAGGRAIPQIMAWRASCGFK